MKEEKFIRMMQLNVKLPNLTKPEIAELNNLLKELPCDCLDKSQCRGICAVERRISKLIDSTKRNN